MQDRQSDVSLFLAILHPDVPFGGIKIDRAQLRELWEFGVKHNVAMLLHSWLRRHEEHLTDDALTFLEGQRSYILGRAARSIRQESEENTIVDLLKLHGIDACIIKGNDISRRIYGDPLSRSSCDIDMLIREKDIAEVNGLLYASGYIRDDEVPLKFWMERIHHAAYSHQTSGHTVEVHWSFGIPSFFALPSDDIWRGTERIGTGRIALTPEMQAIQMLMHHHMHAFRELRSLVDLLWIFHVYRDAIDWHHFFLRLRQIGLIRTLQITLHQFSALWEESCGRMQSLQVLRAACQEAGYAEPAILCRYFYFSPSGEQTSHPLIDKLVMRFALDRKASIGYSFLKSFVPSPETIKTLYGDGRNWTLPVHYLRFLGWRIREWSAN
jgi:hypothetical protein